MQNIALHIFDIVRNSVEAKATEITIELFIDDDNDKIVFCINDNGIGMDEETL